MRSAHVCGIEELCIPKSSTSKGEIVENKQSLSSPAGERENIMGTMDINPLLIKLSVPMMVSMLVLATYNIVDSIYVSRNGVASALVSLPLRYMHSPVETAALTDVENTIKLLLELIKSLKPEDTFGHKL